MFFCHKVCRSPNLLLLFQYGAKTASAFLVNSAAQHARRKKKHNNGLVSTQHKDTKVTFSKKNETSLHFLYILELFFIFFFCFFNELVYYSLWLCPAFSKLYQTNLRNAGRKQDPSQGTVDDDAPAHATDPRNPAERERATNHYPASGAPSGTNHHNRRSAGMGPHAPESPNRHEPAEETPPHESAAEQPQPRNQRWRKECLPCGTPAQQQFWWCCNQQLQQTRSQKCGPSSNVAPTCQKHVERNNPSPPQKKKKKHNHGRRLAALRRWACVRTKGSS